jgi:hypothetical protein
VLLVVQWEWQGSQAKCGHTPGLVLPPTPRGTGWCRVTVFYSTHTHTDSDHRPRSATPTGRTRDRPVWQLYGRTTLQQWGVVSALQVTSALCPPLHQTGRHAATRFKRRRGDRRR